MEGKTFTDFYFIQAMRNMCHEQPFSYQGNLQVFQNLY